MNNLVLILVFLLVCCQDMVVYHARLILWVILVV